VDGGPLTLRAVVIRNVLRIVDWLPLLYLLGGFLVLYSRNGQRLGDLVAGTTVVYRHHANPGETRSSSRAARRILAGALVLAVVFTLAFDYFGRPWLVIEGMYILHTQFPAGTTSYSLGSPQPGPGGATFPVT